MKTQTELFEKAVMSFEDGRLVSEQGKEVFDFAVERGLVFAVTNLEAKTGFVMYGAGTTEIKIQYCEDGFTVLDQEGSSTGIACHNENHMLVADHLAQVLKTADQYKENGLAVSLQHIVGDSTYKRIGIHFPSKEEFCSTEAAKGIFGVVA